MALLFVEPSESEILANTVLFLHVASYFFPALGLLCILRYAIQGVGYTGLAMFSGVSEMIARILVSLYAVPVFGYMILLFWVRNYYSRNQKKKSYERRLR